MSILDVLKQNEQFYRDLDQGIVSGNRLPLLPNEDVMYNSVIPTDYSTLQKDESEEDEYEDLDVLRFKNMDLQSGYLDRAGSYPDTNFDFNQPNFFQRMLNKTGDMFGSSRDLIGTGITSLMGLASGIPGLGLISQLMDRNPPSQIAYNRMLQQGYGPQLNSIYGPGGIMQNYNKVSAFGPSPLESILNRRNKILERKQAGKAYGASNLEQLNQAIASIGGEGGGAGSFDTSSTPKGETMGDFSGSTRSSKGRQDY